MVAIPLRVQLEYTLIYLVGVTGLEPATSRPPAVRATNCATPRYDENSIALLI
jgi:hypothetical protein